MITMTLLKGKRKIITRLDKNKILQPFESWRIVFLYAKFFSDVLIPWGQFR